MIFFFKTTQIGQKCYHSIQGFEFLNQFEKTTTFKGGHVKKIELKKHALVLVDSKIHFLNLGFQLSLDQYPD